MDHLAIMESKLAFIPKILDGRKTIESRWYKIRRAPWGKIKRNDVVYFKNSGKLATTKATVTRVVEYNNLTNREIKRILGEHWKRLGIPKEGLSDFYKRVENKNYCILMFLKNPQKVTPFKVNKRGFGTMASWICVEDINKLKF